VDWAKLYRADPTGGAPVPKRLPLPTYPFANERHWVDFRRVPDYAGVERARPERSEEHSHAQNAQPQEHPRNEFEGAVMSIWKELLGIEQISLDDDFLSVGGNSIVAAQIIARLQRRYPAELSLTDIYKVRTVAEMAEILEEALLDAVVQEEFA
jgi:acyl carrier protein